jgi:DNA-binding PadR family transcriptional regulator
VGRIFGRGELSRVLLVVIASIGEGHGYTIMQELEQRVGGGWKASPGAIYPALLTLQDAGLVEAEDRDGSRIYRLTQQGRNVIAEQYPSAASWESLSARAEASRQQVTLARLLRDFQADLPEHRNPLSPEQAAAIGRALGTAAEEIEHILADGGTDG